MTQSYSLLAIVYTVFFPDCKLSLDQHESILHLTAPATQTSHGLLCKVSLGPTLPQHCIQKPIVTPKMLMPAGWKNNNKKYKVCRKRCFYLTLFVHTKIVKMLDGALKCSENDFSQHYPDSAHCTSFIWHLLK